jgi:hypothetical protein
VFNTYIPVFEVRELKDLLRNKEIYSFVCCGAAKYGKRVQTSKGKILSLSSSLESLLSVIFT